MRPIAFAGAILLSTLAVGCGFGGGDEDQNEGLTGASGAGEEGTDDELQVSTADWSTDFSKNDVPLSEFLGGGPPKDGIPSIDDPKFVSVDEADEFLKDPEPVSVLELNGEARGYPIQILIWHEVVNDELGGEPVAVTYCPLCNSTIAFSRDLDGETFEFGVSGLLRRSNLVMYDRETESWWQQIGGNAVVGELTGATLEALPSQILSWEEFKNQHPDSEVLSRDTGFDRDYGNNPYTAYDRDENEQPFLLRQQADETLAPKARVTTVQTGERQAVVYPFKRLESDAPLNDEIDGDPVVVFFDAEVASALDSSLIAEGRNVGSAAVFKRTVDGQTLEFEPGEEPGTFRDRQTGSTWNFSGRATGRKLEATELKQLASNDQFWFSVAAFFEDPDIRR